MPWMNPAHDPAHDSARTVTAAHALAGVIGRALAGAALGVLLPIGAAQAATTGCGPSTEAVAAADVVFVGTLTDVSADGSHATFEIEDVWRGANLSLGISPPLDAPPGTFPVAPAGAAGLRYLVLAQTVGGTLRTGDTCPFFPFQWDASFAVFRPIGASLPPAAEGAQGGGVPGTMLALVAAAAAIGVGGFLAFRSRPGGA